jgi:hypothetical protein
MRWDSCQASGARSSRAPDVILTALNAADFIAVVAPPDRQPELTEAVREELLTGEGVRVLCVENTRAPWLDDCSPNGPLAGQPYDRFGVNLDATRDFLTGWGAPDPSVRRAVLLWSDVDTYIAAHADGFDGMVEVLCESLSQPEPDVWEPFMLHKAVLIGGDALFERFEKASARLPETVRCRYVLVR